MRRSERYKGKEIAPGVIVPDSDGDELSHWLRALTYAIVQRDESRRVFGGMCGPYGYGVDFQNETFAMHWDRQHPECDCGGSQPKHRPECDRVTKMSEYLSIRWGAGRMTDEEIAAAGGLSNFSFEKVERWTAANPSPSCSCGEERAWLNRHQLKKVPSVDASFFDRVGGNARKFEHTEECDLSVYARPHFLHKPSGLTVRWYKSIGRDQDHEMARCESLRTMMEDCFRSIGSDLDLALRAYEHHDR